MNSFRLYPPLNLYLISPLSEVHLHHSWGVDWEALVWVDHNTEQTRVGVDQLGLVPGLQVPENGGVVEEGQVGHVFTLLKLGRVDLEILDGKLMI